MSHNQHDKLYLAIRNLTRLYTAHLDTEQSRSLTGRSKKILAQKRAIASALLHLDYDTDPFAWLNTKVFDRFTQTPQTRAALITRRRTPLLITFLQVSLIAVTFPLSLPALAIWSKIKRNTGQFWKTDGQILADTLHIAADTIRQSPHDHLENRTPSPRRNKMKSSYINNLRTLLQPWPADVEIPPPAEEYPIPTKPYSACPTMGAYLHSIFVDVLTGEPHLHDYHFHLREAEGHPEIPAMLEIDLHYELFNTAPAGRPDLFTLEQLRTLKEQYPDMNLRKGLERYLTVQIFTEIPFVRPTFPDAPGQPLTMETLASAIPFPVYSHQNSTPGFFDSAHAYLKQKWQGPDDFDRLMVTGSGPAALPKARNITEIVRALEMSIYFLTETYNSTVTRRDQIAKQLAAEKDPRYKQAYTIALANFNQKVADAERALHSQINQLPDQYWLHSPRILILTAALRQTMDLILEGRFNEALAVFDYKVRLDPFTHSAAPNIIAWDKQVKALFGLLRRSITLMPGEPNVCYTNLFNPIKQPTESDSLGKMMKAHAALLPYHSELAEYFKQKTMDIFGELICERLEHQSVAMKTFGHWRFPPGFFDDWELRGTEPEKETVAAIEFRP